MIPHQLLRATEKEQKGIANEREGADLKVEVSKVWGIYILESTETNAERHGKADI